jgi:hypothetical protein
MGRTIVAIVNDMIPTAVMSATTTTAAWLRAGAGSLRAELPASQALDGGSGLVWSVCLSTFLPKNGGAVTMEDSAAPCANSSTS